MQQRIADFLIRARTSLARRYSPVDLLLVLTGVLFACSSLTYPFGHDQGVHYYVGREWLEHGSLPYRDAFDYKTPGIFFLHALLIAIFGHVQWAIRLADLFCVAALGLICATLADPSGRQRGTTGAATLAAFVLYYGFFLFWDTGQCEIWCVTFALGGLATVRQVRSPLLAVLLAGVLSGLALLMKPPGAVFVAVTLFEAARRRPRVHWLRHTLLFSIGVLAFPSLLAAHFAAHHALSAARDVLIGADWQYVSRVRRVNTLTAFFWEFVGIYQWFNPFSSIALAVLGNRTAELLVHRSSAGVRRYALSVGLAVAALVGIGIQLKFYRYHSVLLVGPGALFAAVGYGEMCDLLSDRPRWTVPTVYAACLLLAFPLAGTPARSWWQANKHALDRLTGRLNGSQFAAAYSIPLLYYNYRDSEAVGRFIRTHSSPSDTIVVRGLQAEVYAVADRRCGGRFFWTTMLTDPQRNYRRAEWLAEDRAAIIRTRPRFVVTLSDIHAGPESSEYFFPLGYRLHSRFGRLSLLEQVPSPQPY